MTGAAGPMLAVGTTNTSTYLVGREMAPPHLDVVVLSTPWMLGLVEQTSLRAVRESLAEHETIVGTGATITHASAAREGEEVTVTSTLTGVGRRLTFEATVTGPRGLVGTVALESAVIDKRRFAR